MEKEKGLEQQQQHAAEGEKLPYQKPRLVCFGSVGELTASGTGSRAEQGPNHEGKCSSDEKRHTCL